MGAGMMILGENVSLPPLMYGGSGTASRELGMPDFPPERFEAGTLPVPAVAGLRHGMEFVFKITAKVIREHEQTLALKLTKKLTALGIKVYLPDHIGSSVLFDIPEYLPEEVALTLDKNGICTRAGLHCAPLAHRTLGSDGAVRVSLSAFNTEAEVIELCRKISQMV